MIRLKPSILEMDFGDGKEEPIALIVDASGLTVSRKGHYIEQKWIRKKRNLSNYICIVDAKSKKVVSFRITKGTVHDAKKFCPLVREAAKKYDIEKLHADKAHDNRRNFNLLDRLNVEPVIAIRNNASTRARGCQSVKKGRSTTNQETWVSEMETDQGRR